ncbi:MAG: DegT/DnrJ/EryC1/StrS family aminotransferase [Pelagibacteraceae bacterium]|mgnify:FL=1|jgi:CDP-6-deoxy-D-xylo-4-hexulose-3-dehydrase|nr:DegT/DnrJ/EryC1/StrS family aminotransferase [Pelagibacteraceae bacterium]MDP6680674.1 DegT/DnrJ/EryC1/StrS family aminotransferase [Pelagibacteraceae bacterium]MDP6710656.1 DegT/DnrJ/EryC1/StrS family aminotransferase [Pelagibacteraceae bacterium]
MKFNHPLMFNNFTKADMVAVIKMLKIKNEILTQSKYVKMFEKKWSKWLGTKYSVFVNSGSSANFLTMAVLKILYGKGEVILPTLTWISDINSVIQNNFKPVFVDINPRNLCMSTDEIIKKVNKNTLAVFITHTQGFNGLTKKLISFLKKKNIALIEDVCESHGATFKNKKLGTFGKISNFSFYYAHHMTTIEGGMICTNDKHIYEMLKMLRSHGMVRESNNPLFEKKMIKKHPYLSSRFIFLYPGYNFRNNEIGAVIGLSQLRSLDKNNIKRKENFKLFIKLLNNTKYRTDFDLEGSCNYAFPVILKTKSLKLRNSLEKNLTKNKIEFRRGNTGGGNQLRQPYLKEIAKKINLKTFSEVEHVHFFGYYIGNYPSLSKSKIKKICNILNRI